MFFVRFCCFVGEVWRGTCRGQEVAIKKLHKQTLDAKTLGDFRKEVFVATGENFRKKTTTNNVFIFLGRNHVEQPSSKCSVVYGNEVVRFFLSLTRLHFRVLALCQRKWFCSNFALLSSVCA